MILQALTGLFEDLVQRGEIARPGWSSAKISYALCLDESGAVTYVVPQLVEPPVGKKTQLRPKVMELPSPVKRTVGILPNFLWDNASYLLGVDDKGEPMACSPDPMLESLQAQLAGVRLGAPESAEGKLEGILSNTVIFGSDLMALGLGGRINSMFKELLAGPGAVRATLKKYLD